MSQLGKNVKFLRDSRGWTQSELGGHVQKLYGRPVSQQAIDQVEKGKTNKPGYISELAEVFGVSVPDLRNNANIKASTQGNGYAKSTARLPGYMVGEPESSESVPMARVREIYVRAGASGGAFNDPADGPAWAFPKEWIWSVINKNPEHLRIITIDGESMESDPPGPKDLSHGDKVLVDISYQMPSTAGIYIIQEDDALIAKNLELLEGTDPQMFKISANNKAFEPYEITFRDIRIWGRVVGRWQRY